MKTLLLLVLLCTGIASATAQKTHTDYSYYDTVQFSVGYEIRFPTFTYDCCDGRCPHYCIYDSLAKFINKHPQVVFQVESHTDCRASAEYNRYLSQRRADTARAELLRLINDTTQLPRAVGMGEDSLFIKKCQCDLVDYPSKCTEAEHQLNRRTLLRVVGRRNND